MSRLALPLLVPFLFSSISFAEVSYQKFSWSGNGEFHLTVESQGRPRVLTGWLKTNESKTFTQTEKSKAGEETLTATIHSYGAENILTVAITSNFNEIGDVFLIDHPDSRAEEINTVTIHDRAAGVAEHLDQVIERLYVLNHKFGPANAARKINEFAATHVTKTLLDLLDEVEMQTAYVKSLPRPTPVNGPGQGDSVTTPRVQTAQGHPVQVPAGTPIAPIGKEDPNAAAPAAATDPNAMDVNPDGTLADQPDSAAPTPEQIAADKKKKDEAEKRKKLRIAARKKAAAEKAARLKQQQEDSVIPNFFRPYQPPPQPYASPFY